MSGSSPLARGIRLSCAAAAARLRFIPTRAGNTRLRNFPYAHALRFIPTRAGNTRHATKSLSANTVHPHSRGEYFIRKSRRGAEAGSSPLARGILQPEDLHVLHRRFIPTRAGNTRRSTRRPRGGAVHPHSRGEYTRAKQMQTYETGSSPLARGIPGTIDPGGAHVRFIPTRAGNTTSWRWICRRSPVHPHSRGEYSMSRPVTSARVGSSPLARGIRRPPARAQPPVRFIPTRAGNTP